MQSEEKKQEIIREIGRSIVWFQKNSEIENILLLSQELLKMETLATTLAQEVITAYTLMNEAEDDYKETVDKFVSEFEGSVAAAEPRARAAAADKKKAWTAAKNAYKRLDTILDRIDKIADAVRQRVSVIKQGELKNIS